MMIQADEDSLRRMLGVEPDQFPSVVVAEYELRLRMFHSDGHSGPIGTVAIIDMLRGFKLGPPRLINKLPLEADWSKVPMDGTVRVEVKMQSAAENGELRWFSGVYLGQVGMGTLAVRLDGFAYVREFRRNEVRFVREKPVEAVEEPDAAWTSGVIDEPVVVEDEGQYKDALFKGSKPGAVLALVKGEDEARSFDVGVVTRIADQAVTTR